MAYQDNYIRVALIVLVIFISGCMLSRKTQDKTALGSISGLKLWEQNCSRCHNSPNPAAFSDEEWEVVGAHMRVRAYLTEKETDKIVEFLKSIN